MCPKPSQTQHYIRSTVTMTDEKSINNSLWNPPTSIIQACLISGPVICLLDGSYLQVRVLLLKVGEVSQGCFNPISGWALWTHVYLQRIHSKISGNCDYEQVHGRIIQNWIKKVLFLFEQTDFSMIVRKTVGFINRVKFKNEWS